MYRLFLLALLLCPAAAPAEHWVRFTSGPFEVLSSAGSKEGRDTLVRFEEFRHALGYVLGENDLQAPLPIRILLYKNNPPQTPERIIRGRDQHAIVLTPSKVEDPDILIRLTRLFLEANTDRMPERLERGLIALFSTLEVSGIRITVGAPPAHPDLDWARIHLLTVDPQYYGNLRVLTYNLRKGVDEEAAFRNAFSKSPEQIEIEAEKHLEAGHFQTASISPLPMSPRDFPERSVDAAAAQLAIADLLLGDSSRAAYQDLIAQKMRVPEAYEGLGLLALRAKQDDEARKDFAAAMQAGSKSAPCYMEYARLENDSGKAIAALEQAAKLNPKLAEPHFLLSQRLPDTDKRIQQLALAAKLDSRNAAYWEALAETQLAEHNYPEAAKAWRSAEQAAATPGDRARYKRARLEIEQQRLDWEAAERQRKLDEEARELEKLKTQARADLHALEARANRGAGEPSSKDKVVPWWDGPKPPGVANGVLKQVDCLGKRLRLVVEADDGKTIKLLVNDPSQIPILSGGERSLACGPQNRSRVKVEYFPKANAKLATAGEAATIEFQ
ncbi:MAG: hypothetical protein U0Q18_06965 [Bryobacteraceae bacterium]